MKAPRKPSPERSAVMRAVKSRDTGPETGGAGDAARRSRPAIASIAPICRASRTSSTAGRRLAIFVHGCFWHGHDCPRGARMPKDNADYWREKIARNRARDARNVAALEAMGWRALVIFECALKDPAALRARLGAALASAAQCANRLRRPLTRCNIDESSTHAGPPGRPFGAPPMPIAVVRERAEAREAAEAEKDAPLRADIRLLGRLLGDTVREQEGDEVYAIVERIRQASIRFHRDNEVGARRELEATLDSLDNDQTLSIVRAFSYFSHLSNIAEDQHHIRRNRAHVRMKSEPRPGALAYAFKRAAEAGIDARALRAFFDHALVSPVLTAHPTEVRRKSTLTRELEIAALLDARQRHAGDEAELARVEEQLRRAILILWRTSMLRQTRLKVIDEVANGLSYYDYTFFRELPRIYGAIEDELARQEPADAGKRVASFLRVGSWIGGDRDGNPYVTAEVLSEATRLQSASALGHYLEELHELGGELSLSSGLVTVSDALAALAERSTDSSTTRRDEPYRRAIAGIYSRLAKTARDLDHVVALRQPLIDAPPYAERRGAWAPISTTIAHSLEANGGAILARGRLRALRRAVDVFGFHLAPLDLRQNSDVHERTVAELFAAATPGVEYLALDEEARVALLRSELRSPRPLVSPFFAYSEETAGELAVFRAAAAIRKTYGPDAIRTSIISKTQGVSDMLELALLLKEVGLVERRRARRAQHGPAVRDDRAICAPASG